MFQLKKPIAILASFLCISSGINISYAQTTTSTTGVFSILNKGDIVEFDGTLFDPTATGVLLTEQENLEEQFKLKLDLELGKEKAKNKLDIDNLKINLKTQEETSKIIIEEKDKELEKLRDMALNSNDYSWLYIGGGFLAGVALTALSVYAAGQLR